MKVEAEERAKTYQSKLEKLEEELTAARESLVQRGRGRARAHRARGRGQGRAHAQGRRVPRRAGAEAAPRRPLARDGRSRGRAPPRSCSRSASRPPTRSAWPRTTSPISAASTGPPPSTPRAESSASRTAGARHERLDRRPPVRAGACWNWASSSVSSTPSSTRWAPSRRAWEASPDLRNAIENPLVAHAAKKAVVERARGPARRQPDDETHAAPARRPPAREGPPLRRPGPARARRRAQGPPPRRGDDRRAAVARSTTPACRPSSRR